MPKRYLLYFLLLTKKLSHIEAFFAHRDVVVSLKTPTFYLRTLVTWKYHHSKQNRKLRLNFAVGEFSRALHPKGAYKTLDMARPKGRAKTVTAYRLNIVMVM